MGDDLIRRLEAATEGSVELNARIAGLVESRIRDRILAEFEFWETRKPGDGWAGVADVLPWAIPDYTRSLDAALTLVPVGHYWLVGAGKMRKSEPLYGAQIALPIIGKTPPRAIGEGEHDATPALALCIAALRARASQAGAPEGEERRP